MKNTVRPRAWRIMPLLLVIAIVAIAQSNADARDVSDILTTPFSDPLLARPPEFITGKTLPGDMEPITCNNASRAIPNPLTLLDAVDFSLCNNAQVRSAWLSIKVEAAHVGEARAAYLPVVNVGMSRLTQKTSYPNSDFLTSSTQSGLSRYATLTWRLLDFGGRDANSRSANALLEAALANHDAVLQKTINSVIGLYFDAQTAKANLDAKQKNEALALQTLEAAKRRESRGLGAQSDTLQAATAFAKAELENSRSSGSYEKSLSTLLLSLGMPMKTMGSEDIRLASDKGNDEASLKKDLDAWLTLAEAQHPALAATRAQLDAAKEKLIATRSEGLPTLDFTPSVYLNGRPNQGLSSGSSRERVIGFTMNFPLFDGFSHTYKVRGAQVQIELKEAELQDTKNQILGEVVKAYADAVSALRNLDSSRHLMSAAKNALDSVRRKYEHGAADILEMLNVQVAVADAEQEYLRTLSDWRSAQLRLLANSGVAGIRDFR